MRRESLAQISARRSVASNKIFSKYLEPGSEFQRQSVGRTSNSPASQRVLRQRRSLSHSSGNELEEFKLDNSILGNRKSSLVHSRSSLSMEPQPKKRITWGASHIREFHKGELESQEPAKQNLNQSRDSQTNEYKHAIVTKEYTKQIKDKAMLVDYVASEEPPASRDQILSDFGIDPSKMEECESKQEAQNKMNEDITPRKSDVHIADKHEGLPIKSVLKKQSIKQGQTFDLRKSVDLTDQKKVEEELIEVQTVAPKQQPVQKKSLNISLNSTTFEDRPSVYREESQAAVIAQSNESNVPKFLQLPRQEEVKSSENANSHKGSNFAARHSLAPLARGVNLGEQSKHEWELTAKANLVLASKQEFLMHKLSASKEHIEEFMKKSTGQDIEMVELAYQAHLETIKNLVPFMQAFIVKEEKIEHNKKLRDQLMTLQKERQAREEEFERMRTQNLEGILKDQTELNQIRLASFVHVNYDTLTNDLIEVELHSVLGLSIQSLPGHQKLVRLGLAITHGNMPSVQVVLGLLLQRLNGFKSINENHEAVIEGVSSVIVNEVARRTLGIERLLKFLSLVSVLNLSTNKQRTILHCHHMTTDHLSLQFSCQVKFSPQVEVTQGKLIKVKDTRSIEKKVDGAEAFGKLVGAYFN